MKRTITILNTQRAKSSKEGNPCYYVTYVEKILSREFYATAITATNSVAGYEEVTK